MPPFAQLTVGEETTVGYLMEKLEKHGRRGENEKEKETNHF